MGFNSGFKELNSEKNKGTSRENHIYFWSYLAQFFLEWEMLKTKFVKKSKHTCFIQ